jgi:hypothetical protein
MRVIAGRQAVWPSVLALLPLLALQRADQPPAGSIVVRAYEFDRGNVRVHDVGMSYADAEPVVINAGQLPNTMEYDLAIPVSATYELFAKYAALQSRPVDIFLDDDLVARGFTSVTGSWQASTAKWEKQAEVEIGRGKHTIKLVCPGPCIPHIVAFRLDSPVPFPEGWRRKPRPIEANLHHTWSGKPEPGKYDFAAYVRPDGSVDAPQDYNPILPYRPAPAPAPRAERILEYLLIGAGKYEVEATVRPDEWGDEWEAELSVAITGERTEAEVLALSPHRIAEMLSHSRRLIGEFRRMIGDGLLAAESEQVAAMLDQLDRLEAMEDGDRAKWEGLCDLYVRAFRLKNRVALSNPLIDFDRLLFAKRLTYNTSHIYTTYFDGSRRYGEGGGLFTLSPVRPEGAVSPLVSELSDTAIYRDPDLSWDATRVLLSYKPDRPTPCRIYEVGIDGSQLRQLTDSDYDDIDPCYLPNGRIMFVSTRCRRVVLCHNAFTVSVLHTMEPDGSDVRCVSTNTVNDFTPSVLSDGRVVYTRWEYVDKHLGNNQSMWIVNPDGSSPAHVAGEHWGPITLWEPRQVPGSPKIVTTLAPHMPIAVGPIALVDPADTCASPAIYHSLTPEIPPPHHFGWHRPQMGYYCNPYPLSEDYFIVSYAYGPDDREPTGYGLYLLDRWNNRDLIYRDPDISCFEAIPVRPRPRPPIVPKAEGAGEHTGRFCLIDVYDGLTGIQRGSVKYLRVVEEIPKPVAAQCSGYGLQYPVISNYGHIALKRLLGTVPVEDDGSAYFEAPADAALYFSALDGDLMEVQRMRSFTQIAPGETISCIGCHEHRTTAPPNTVPRAMRRNPSPIAPPPGGVRAIDFVRDVQPILDRHCARCHTGQKPSGGLHLAPAPTNLFNVAYENLTGRGLVSYIDVRRSDTLPLRPPKYYGSHASKLIEVLRTSHSERVSLSAADFRALVTWIDLNAPYYGTYLYTRPGTVGGRELLTPAIRKRLEAVYERRCASCHQQDVARVQRVSFAAVEQSPALLAPLSKAAGGTEACGQAVFPDLTDPDAKEITDALDQLGREMRENPRMDMLPERPPLLDPNCRYVYRP